MAPSLTAPDDGATLSGSTELVFDLPAGVTGCASIYGLSAGLSVCTTRERLALPTSLTLPPGDYSFRVVACPGLDAAAIMRGEALWASRASTELRALVVP